MDGILCGAVGYDILQCRAVVYTVVVVSTLLNNMYDVYVGRYLLYSMKNIPTGKTGNQIVVDTPV